MPTYGGGRHEHGQNFLNDKATVSHIVGLVARTVGPVVEIGPGRGVLTFDLQDMGRLHTVVEIDPRLARRLAERLDGGVRVVNDDFLRWRLPREPHVVVGNLPFHHTTAILRKVLHAPGWTDAVLMTQWEVARRRAGVGGATMMTAQWWPWVRFALAGRVPASAFTPRPSVDAGVLTMTRRPEPLVSPTQRQRYREFVHAVFTGRGRGLPAILAEVCGPATRRPVREWLTREEMHPAALPKHLSAEQWAELFALATARRNPRRPAPGQRTRRTTTSGRGRR